MRSARFLVTRIAPVCVLVFGVVALASACSSSSSSKSTPTIQYETPTQGPTQTPTTAAASSSTASSSPGASGSAGAGGAIGTNVSITAKDTKFDKSRIVVPAGKQITVKMTNDDSVPHNFAVYDKAGGKELYAGQIFGGPNVTKTDTFTAPSKPGNYYFQCDVHPTQMNGTLVVQ